MTKKKKTTTTDSDKATLRAISDATAAGKDEVKEAFLDLSEMYRDTDVLGFVCIVDTGDSVDVLTTLDVNEMRELFEYGEYSIQLREEITE